MNTTEITLTDLKHLRDGALFFGDEQMFLIALEAIAGCPEAIEDCERVICDARRESAYWAAIEERNATSFAQ